MKDKNQGFIEKLKNVNPKLTPFGFVILPYLTGKQVGDIESALSINDEKKLKEIYFQYVFQPINRSFFTHRFQKLSILENYSHLYQLGIIHYYNFDHISSNLLLVTCLEGVIRELFGKKIGENTGYNLKVIINNLNNLKNTNQIPEFQERFELYIDSLNGLFNSLFKKIDSNSDIPLNEFNRHVMIHVLKSDSYRIENAIRLICILDLLCEIQSLRTNKETYALIPDEFADNDLTKYYKEIFNKTMNSEQEKKLELLKENKKFKIK